MRGLRIERRDIMGVIGIILTTIFIITVVSRVGILLIRSSIEDRKKNPLFICILNDITNVWIIVFIVLLIVFYFTHR